jgi:hypothetical protein
MPIVCARNKSDAKKKMKKKYGKGINFSSVQLIKHGKKCHTFVADYKKGHEAGVPWRD